MTQNWSGEFIRYEEVYSILSESDKELSATRALLTEAVKALEPFARHADAYHSFDGQHDFLDTDKITLGAFKIEVGDLRRARATLSKIKAGAAGQ
jgi:hypothetical protein